MRYVGGSMTRGGAPLPRPASVQDGDLLFLWAFSDQGAAIATPSGWVPEASHASVGASAALFSRDAHSEPGSYTYVISASGQSGYGVAAYRGSRGIDTVGALNVVGSTRAAGWPALAPSVTPTESQWEVGFWWWRTDAPTGAVLPPAGWTQRLVFADRTDAVALVADRIIPDLPTGDQTAKLDTSLAFEIGDQAAGIQVALRSPGGLSMWI